MKMTIICTFLLVSSFFSLPFTATSADTNTALEAQATMNSLREYSEGKPSGYGTANAIIYDVETAITEAKSAGIDVSNWEAQLPALKDKALLFYARKTMSDLRDYGMRKPSGYNTANLIIWDVETAIAEAKAAGIDVTILEIQFPELKKKAKLFFAIKSFNDLVEYATGKPSGYNSAMSAIFDAINAINDAMELGANVDSLRIQLPKLMIWSIQYEGQKS